MTTLEAIAVESERYRDYLDFAKDWQRWRDTTRLRLAVEAWRRWRDSEAVLKRKLERR